MIFSRRRHIRFSLVLILTVLSHFGLNPALYSGDVWCFGKDGHVALESAHHHHGGEQSDQQTLHSTDATQLSASKSDCTDIAYPNVDQVCNLDFSKDFTKLTLNDFGIILGIILFILPYLIFPATFRLQRTARHSFVDPSQRALRSIIFLN